METPPNGTIKQFGVIGRCDRHNIARQLVDLHEKEGHHTLNLPCFVNIAALLTDRVEFIEEQHTGDGAGIVKELGEPRVRFTKIGADQRVIAHSEKLDG